MLAAFLRTGVAALAILLYGCGASASSDLAAIERAKQSGRSVALEDGRTLFLRCTGKGSPTVLLESGYGATSQAWYAVQPALSRTTRVCSYDRAGSGFSSAGPEPRDGASIARDLDTALDAARIEGPFILVGHSAGGLYGRLFAARRAADMQGLVLLDPTVPRRAPPPPAPDGLEGLRGLARKCLAVSEMAPQPPLDDGRWSGCVGSNPDPWAAATVRRPDAWRAQISELDNLYGRTSEQVARIGAVLRPVPTYVFTASDTAAMAPKYGLDNPRSGLELQHEMIAGGSIEGSQQTILSSHLIMIDRPEVVIGAVEEMIRASRAGRPPAKLPPSELATPAEAGAFSAPEGDPLKAPDAPPAAPGLQP
ncbi:MAG: alpha/beta hydrolase [Alphaproteobacteria bacterium]|nr:alpha/beta hydrolase [Alphaproteobacteria bacterium]MBU1516827.1 alpha/beta hydrolase [Alphaproteobacteria bacterium]MBU2092521.1 alpha/beta hydrolase [Alphaproteobacteria bacterium]MBU2151367.1 alpha/beta hydrolase [Alphaproteobacteria bacterium]MBU2309670.1 alpha/beta hydrolase [Alphaproteobacteria bacterium]